MTTAAGDAEGARCRQVLAGLPPAGLFADERGGPLPFRVSPAPFGLTAEGRGQLASQGRLWLKFLKAAQQLYLASARGDAPAFVAEYLDAGKPDRIRDFGRMNRFRTQFPCVLRPDLLLTETGFAAIELDSVPGGFGLLGCLTRQYARLGHRGTGGDDAMVDGFARALAFAAGSDRPPCAIVVSEESRMYRPEMDWLATALRDLGRPCWAVHPEDLLVGEAGVSARVGGTLHRLAVAYRFFELFDLPNVPHGEALLDAAKLKRLRLTAPPKAFLEEKLLFALLHHPVLAPLWDAALGEADFARLTALVAPTWVVDPRPIPPHAAVAGLTAGGRVVQSWSQLAGLSQRERAFVVKASGFSANAWGSHSVRFGPDLSQEDWAGVLRAAEERFATSPHVLQPYLKPRIVRQPYYDAACGEVRTMDGRVRLTPYYYVTGEDDVELGGVMATVCPADKKAVHGMPEAVMVPCAEAERTQPRPDVPAAGCAAG